ncbi:glycosyltransferase family 2 protein [Ruegeria sp. R13_0]|uniref:glycosyltransferase family 2 protein n=1 Tax=Ruegeria sp. R13_0 TaxID=2821099 RepID=UPI001AD998DF|nr:glycosyltransferase family A protein [Ruegeria sp. R13_0]MBO9436769.1 glycosyltransferase family 2 protein [Ruegeria sp. R13_0]
MSDAQTSPLPRIGVVLIGRNEGDRLINCLNSIPQSVGRIVYVDSGSTDGSVAAAHAEGAQVVELNLSQPFTAARARNAGFEALRAQGDIDYVQFVDGDCTLHPDWIDVAAAFLGNHPQAVVVCGRRREMFPEASVYNRLCDREWNTPVGQAKSCGGDAMMRSDAFTAAGGFNPALIAGEEPELCVRLRHRGGEVWRIDHEMTTHDAAMTRAGQWWNRMRRGGHAAAEGAALHGGPPERHGVAARTRALLWGAALPLATLLAALLLTPWALLLLLLYPAQVLRLARRDSFSSRAAWEQAFFLTLGKFPEALGVLEFQLRRLTRLPAGLIEYK